MIYIYSPSNSTTGGVELLHQLSNAIFISVMKVQVIYYPETSGGNAYSHFSKVYHVDVFTDDVQSIDLSDNILIVGENATHYLRNFQNINRFIFWMSVDNFFPKKERPFLLNFYYKLKEIYVGKRLRINELKSVYHLTQSNYANLFLKKLSIPYFYLGDYINDDFFNKSFEKPIKENIILYNPKKGFKHMYKLIRKFPNFKFVPLVNLNRVELINIISTAKLYIDFGLHPGKDRFPREASILGCCIITNRLGSAKNDFDIPISDQFKIDTNSLNYEYIESLINVIFNDYENQILNFENYRNKISSEKEIFFENVKNTFLKFI